MSVCLSVCLSGIKLLSHHATNRDQVCFCRQVSTRLVDNCHGFFSLLCLGRAENVQTYHPTKNFRFFSFLSPVFGEQPPKHAVDLGSEESIVQRPNGQVRSFRGPPSRPSFSTGPWSSCIVTGHDRLVTVTSQRTMPAPQAACQ